MEAGNHHSVFRHWQIQRFASAHLKAPVGVIDKAFLVLINQHTHHICTLEPEILVLLLLLFQHQRHPVH
jgi:acyl-ACP thioesterase